MKRQSYNWLEQSSKDHWLTVATMTNNTIESVKLDAGSDLKRALIGAISKWSDDGWDVESFSSSSPGFFCNNDGVRRHVCIRPTDPGHVAPIYRPR